MERGTILDKAKQVINGERQDAYGQPEDCFALIADYWTLYWAEAVDFKPHDVAMMMALFKIARAQSGKYHEDNYIDAAGYIALANDLHRGK